MDFPGGIIFKDPTLLNSCELTGMQPDLSHLCKKFMEMVNLIYLKFEAQMDSEVELFFVKFQPTERLYSWALN